jgi:hypothetical protein
MKFKNVFPRMVTVIFLVSSYDGIVDSLQSHASSSVAQSKQNGMRAVNAIYLQSNLKLPASMVSAHVESRGSIKGRGDTVHVSFENRDGSSENEVRYPDGLPNFPHMTNVASSRSLDAQGNGIETRRATDQLNRESHQADQHSIHYKAGEVTRTITQAGRHDIEQAPDGRVTNVYSQQSKWGGVTHTSAEGQNDAWQAKWQNKAAGVVKRTIPLSAPKSPVTKVKTGLLSTSAARELVRQQATRSINSK